MRQEIIRQQWKSIAALVILITAFGIASPHFLTPSNLLNVLQQSSINAVLGIGLTFVIITAGIDLSVGSVLALCGLLFADLLVHGYSLSVALIATISAGTLCGIVNGTITILTRIPPFITTLGMMLVARSAATVYSGSRPISGLPTTLHDISGSWFGLPLFIPCVAVLYAMAHIILTRTKLGRYTYAIGSNERAAWLAGIAVGRYKIAVYAISGTMAGIAAVMMTTRLNAASPLAGEMYELYAIAAAVIGGVSLIGGEGRITGTLIGALIMGILRNGLNLLGVPAAWEGIVIGSVVIIAVVMDRQRHDTHVHHHMVLTLPMRVAAFSTMLIFIVGGAGTYRYTHQRSIEKITIAFIPKTNNSSFWSAMEEGAHLAANKANVHLLSLAPDRETDVERQMQIVENAIFRGVDAIVLAPSGARELVPVLLKANQAGIPLLAVDSRFDEKTIASMGAEFLGFVGSDNVMGGRLAGEGLAKHLNARGDVAILEGIPGHETSNNRKRGFSEAIAQFPNMHIVASLTAQCERQQGFTVTQNILQAHPNVRGIFAANDEMAFGALEAVASAGKSKDIAIIGFDATPAARQSITQGKLYGSVAQFPEEMGRVSIELTHALIQHGIKPASVTETRVELITRENAQ